jgi:hypothetical protein
MTNYASDIHVALSAFVGVIIAEALVKPVAVRIGQVVIRAVDSKIGIIPDWLSKP